MKVLGYQFQQQNLCKDYQMKWKETDWEKNMMSLSAWFY